MAQLTPRGPTRRVSATVRSQKGKERFYDDAGFEYGVERTNLQGDTYYRCPRKGCRGRGKNLQNGKVISSSGHNHPPALHQSEVRTIRKEALNDRHNGLDTAHIVHQRVLHAAPHVKAQLNLTATARALQRAVEIPGMLEWPAEIDVALFAAPFLRRDNCGQFPAADAEAFKLFYTAEGRNLLENVEVWTVDGTFASAPEGFVQVLIIGVQIGHLFIPAAFAFLVSKETRSYRAVFEELSQSGIRAPDFIVSDFEKGLRSGYEDGFGRPGTSYMFCGFHYMQLIIRKIKAFGLSDLLADVNKQLYVRGLLLLALIDPRQVINYYEALRREALVQVSGRLHPNILGLYDYYEKHFIGAPDPADARFRVAPTYEIPAWSLYQRIWNDSQLGNSTIEGFNARLKPLPKRSSAQRVALELFGLAEHYRLKDELAQLKNLTLEQCYPRSRARLSFIQNRKLAVQNGPHQLSPCLHLATLIPYVSHKNW